MTRPGDSPGMAEEIRRKEALGRLADLYTGDLYEGDPPRRRAPGPWLWALGLGLTLGAGITLALTDAAPDLRAVPERPQAERGRNDAAPARIERSVT